MYFLTLSVMNIFSQLFAPELLANFLFFVNILSPDAGQCCDQQHQCRGDEHPCPNYGEK